MGKLELKLPNFFELKRVQGSGGASASRGSELVVPPQGLDGGQGVARSKSQPTQGGVAGGTEVNLARIEDNPSSKYHLVLNRRVGRQDGVGATATPVGMTSVREMTLVPVFEPGRRAEKRPIEQEAGGAASPKRARREKGSLSKQGFVFKYNGEEPFETDKEACAELHRDYNVAIPESFVEELRAKKAQLEARIGEQEVTVLEDRDLIISLIPLDASLEFAPLEGVSSLNQLASSRELPVTPTGSIASKDPADDLVRDGLPEEKGELEGVQGGGPEEPKD